MTEHEKGKSQKAQSCKSKDGERFQRIWKISGPELTRQEKASFGPIPPDFKSWVEIVAVVSFRLQRKSSNARICDGLQGIGNMKKMASF